MQAFSASSNLPLIIYRVKASFTTSDRVYWPLGAIRFWTNKEKDEFIKSHSPDFGSITHSIQWFDARFEIVNFPEGDSHG